MKHAKQKPQNSPAHHQTAPTTTPPTTAQLASLAATLAKNTTLSSKQLVNQALEIWEAARELLSRPNSTQEVSESRRLPTPKGYPITLDNFLNLMVPKLKGRTGDRAALFRQYLKYRLRNPTHPPFVRAYERHVPVKGTTFDCLNPRITPPTMGVLMGFSAEKPDTLPEPTKDDVDNRVASWQATPIPDAPSYYYHARYFLDWYERIYEKTHQAEISKKRREAGAEGHKRQNEKKHQKALTTSSPRKP